MAASSVTIKDKDILYKKILKANKELHSSYVNVGILSSAGNVKSGEINMAGLGAIQEFGASINVTDKMRGFFRGIGFPLSQAKKKINIPARPFMSQTFDSRKKDIDNIIMNEVFKINSGKQSVETALKRVGEIYKGYIQKTFKSGEFEANSEMTVQRKKSSRRPLIDTGRLRSSINYEVKK